ncbi:MAG: hypothetical protein R2688_07090 [Fimbriimonadaceae bacterium]
MIFNAVLAGLTITPAPRLLWQQPFPTSTPLAVKADPKRNYVYIALKEGGVAIIRTNEMGERPQVVKGIPRKDFGGLQTTNLIVDEYRLFVSLGDFFSSNGDFAGVAEIDISTPESAKVQKIWKSSAKLKGATMPLVANNRLILAAMNHGVFAFSNTEIKPSDQPSQIILDRNFPKSNPNSVQEPNSRGIAVKSDLLFVAHDAGGLRAVNISDEGFGREIGKYVNQGMKGKQSAYNNVVIDGDLAYCAIDYAGMEILDISNPKEINQVAWWNPWNAQSNSNTWFNSQGHTNQLVLDRSTKRVYLSAGDSELQVIDVSDSRSPKLVDKFGMPKNKQGAWGIDVKNGVAYLTYIRATVPFQGTWAGLKAIRL